jgi:hypothetical protein
MNEVIMRRSGEYSELHTNNEIAKMNIKLEQLFINNRSTSLTTSSPSPFSITLDNLLLGQNAFIINNDIDINTMKERKRIEIKDLLSMILLSPTNNQNLGGRISGDKEWKESRGENGLNQSNNKNYNYKLPLSTNTSSINNSNNSCTNTDLPKWLIPGLCMSSNTNINKQFDIKLTSINKNYLSNNQESSMNRLEKYISFNNIISIKGRRGCNVVGIDKNSGSFIDYKASFLDDDIDNSIDNNVDNKDLNIINRNNHQSASFVGVMKSNPDSLTISSLLEGNECEILINNKSIINNTSFGNNNDCIDVRLLCSLSNSSDSTMEAVFAPVEGFICSTISHILFINDNDTIKEGIL